MFFHGNYPFKKVITGGVAIKDTKIGNGPEAKKGKTIQV